MAQNTTLEELRKFVTQIYPTAHHGPIGTPSNPASSCKAVAEWNLQSGYYWIVNTTGPPTRVYCDVTRQCCGSTGGWMRVAYLDMTDPTHHCPPGFRLITSPKRTCGRPGSGCVSTTFQAHGIEYSKVCGRVIGYQYGNVDAFEPYYNSRTRTIDDLYVDGVSITHGHSPRKHIWTFANAQVES